LKAYGLSYAQLKEKFPRLVYCSITGFGQTGPYASRAGYDFLIQGMGGIMSLTGEPNGEPMKVGVAVADVMAGMYATVGILAALRHRDQTGQGQHIDIGLLDTQIAWLANAGTNFLESGKTPQRFGNGHPNIVPYQVFPTADDPIIVAVGNDSQFRKLCDTVGESALGTHPDSTTNVARVKNRQSVIETLTAALKRHGRQHWIEALEKVGVPCGPVNTLAQVFDDPHVKARGAVVRMPHPAAQRGDVHLLANPIRLSETPVQYRITPPMQNQHEQEILQDWLGD
jgi:crotonobetainyl-CoA:carnitine CoA-transferase CaiB-like acyl-CoA transferase